MKLRRFIAVILIAATAHAQEAPPPVPPAPIPAAPAITVTVRDTFTEALASAYNTNPKLKAEREAVKVLDEGVSEAFSGWRPTITSDYIRGRKRQQSGTAQDWAYADTTTKQLDLEQPLFSGGELMSTLKSARALMKAGRARLRGVEQEVLLEAVTAYVNLAERAVLLDLSRSNVAVLSRHREVTQARFDAGELTRTDVKQAESRLSRAESEMQTAQGALGSAQAAFERVIGFKPEIYPLPEARPPLPATLEEAQTHATASFPDLIEAKFNEKAADNAIGIQTADILPRLSLQGHMGRTDGSNIPGVGRFDQDTLTLNLSVPLYQSGGEYARIRAAKRQYQERRYESVEAQNGALEGVTRAWHDYHASLAVITSGESEVAAAQSAVEGVSEEYEHGERTTLDVLDAEQELFGAKVRLAQARRNKIVLAYNLLAYAGRLNAEVLALPVEIYDPITHYDAVKWLPLGF